MTKYAKQRQAKPRITARAAGLLFSPPGLIVICVVLLWAAWSGLTVIAIICGLAISAAGLSVIWGHLALKNLRGECSFSDLRGFPGDKVEFKLRMINRKVLPLPWAEINLDVPTGFPINEKASESDLDGFVKITRSSPLLWYSVMSWKGSLSGRKRGYYRLGPLSVTTGDIFGFYPRTLIEPSADHLIVYPRLFDIDRLTLSTAYPLGEALSEKRWFEDPSRTIGVRDYSPGDSLRRIHWKASARRQQLQVKVFESTTTLKVALFLVADSFQRQETILEDELETGISMAASLASYCIEKKNQVGLWTNSRLADSGLPARIPAGSGVECLVQILEALAKATPASHQTFSQFFQSESEQLPAGATLVFIFSRVSPELITTLVEARNSGYKILALQTGEATDSEIWPEIPRYLIDPSGQITAVRYGGTDAGS